MIYNFRDTTDHTAQTASLPAEAMSINGVYIENVISGYRTLYTKGREMLSPDLDLGTVGVRHGSFTKNKRFPARIITVGYQLLCESATAFRQAYNQLNDLLNVEDARLIFRDEQDKFFTGTPQDLGEVDAGRNNVTAEFTIVCNDPFKYSITEYEALPVDGVFNIQYNGTFPAHPILEADFWRSATPDSTHGGCGYVSFIDDRGHVMQFGNPEEPDLVRQILESLDTTYLTKGQVFNWNATQGLTGWRIDDGYVDWWGDTIQGSLKVDTLADGSTAVMLDDAGTAPMWHGSSMTIDLPSDGGDPATYGAKDFTVQVLLRFAQSRPKWEHGQFEFWMLDENTKPIAGVQVSTDGRAWDENSVWGYVNVRNSSADPVLYVRKDLGYNNKTFGYAKTGEAEPPCSIIITKSGGEFSFKFGDTAWTWTDNRLADVVSKKITTTIFANDDYPPCEQIGIYNISVISDSIKHQKGTDSWEELAGKVLVWNTFNCNDILVADCNDGTIRLTNYYAPVAGGLRPDLGALGNDWEQMMLEKGSNRIYTKYSDWLTAQYAPTFKIRYRERFL